MDVAILGGGIAGLATAISLKRIGMKATVYERRQSVHDLGAGIVCWPNASFVLNELGVLDVLRPHAGKVRAMRRISKDGVELGSLDVQRLDATMGYPSLSVLRQDLMRVLLRRVERDEIPIHYEMPVTSIVETGATCRVQFSDGTTIAPRMVVGADGRMNSIARRYILKDNRPAFQGFANWIGVFRCARTAFDRMEICDYWGVGARFGIVPVSANVAYWAAGAVARGDEEEQVDEHLADLRQTFGCWPGCIGEIISQAADSRAKYIRLYDHDPVSTWHRGNVIMIGDAAHAALPTSGQGVAQALEDAWWLAREIDASPTDLDAAMTAFTQRRFQKTTTITMGGRQFADTLFCSDADACERRDRQAQQADYVKMAMGMAAAWSAGLPLGG
ncbi:FAD-dependent urate hydroxylase [Stieleria neptunia]|uniref:FAD-dependent urate hydroxylase n=1 Tax=Stieleria neptunia TaxID=2527979 RepID=A0A518HTM9_9BACT|nr:FAD-dependent monooxygenase [Stieleria neptunia]QDV44181.1 FAD-dependent urate hydroxylase [Stieleria neptunia]